jgi:heat-inducible transcriptional repressor
MQYDLLTEREKDILKAVVQHFVLTGSPVGSYTLSKNRSSELSSASIRNVMADLEDKGFLGHPHTSAGRIPTTKGYRHYVDHLVSLAHLTEYEKELIRENIGQFGGDLDLILDKTAQVIARISNQLGVILTPKFEEGILEKLEIIQVSSDKILVILSIKDGIARTILLEVRHTFKSSLLEKLVQLLNERIGGLRIREIKQTFHKRVKDLIHDETGIIRLFVESADNLFDFERYANLKYTGAKNILSNPEFSDLEKFAALIEMFEERNIIIHMMERRSEAPGIKVTIGKENEEKPIQECSIITAPYKMGDVDGLLGVIGPMRMAYKRIIPVVDFTAKLITEIFHEK